MGSDIAERMDDPFARMQLDEQEVKEEQDNNAAAAVVLY